MDTLLDAEHPSTMAPSKRNPPPDGYKYRNAGEPWFIVIEDPARQLVSCEPLPAEADLRTAMNEQRSRMAAEGWSLEEPFRYGPQFYASKDGLRVFVRIGAVDPALRMERMYRR